MRQIGRKLGSQEGGYHERIILNCHVGLYSRGVAPLFRLDRVFELSLVTRSRSFADLKE